MTQPICNGCRAPLTTSLIDLGLMPLVNAYPDESWVDEQPRFPLHTYVCDKCLLVQVPEVVPPDAMFSDYPYFSSYAGASWLAHVARFAREAQSEFGLDENSLVVEVASNDGYLLKNFIEAGIPVFGVEPATNVAKVANEAGVPTENRFFGLETAQDIVSRGKSADLLVANNVMAHVPDLNDFVAGLATVLKPDGVLSGEFTHMLRILETVQFDTMYHEHFSYFSLIALEPVLHAHGLELFDVVELPTHGGSLRILAQHAGGKRPQGAGLERVRSAEKGAGLDRLETYHDFAKRSQDTIESVRSFFSRARDEGKTTVGYGAAAKGTILLNAARATPDDVAAVVDVNPHKQGRYLPGTHIPIHAPESVKDSRPDYLMLLAWNLRDEIMDQMSYIRDWNAQFVMPVPEARIVD